MTDIEYTVHRTGYIFILMTGIATTGFGLLPMLGWILHFPFLTSFGSHLVPMAPSTALLLILIGIALSLRSRTPQYRGMYFVGMSIGLLVAIMGLIFFFSSIAGIYPRFEHLGFSINNTLKGILVGHMSPATAACFMICALAFLLTLSQSVGHSKRAWIALVLASFVILTSLLFLIAYLLISPLMYGEGLIPPSLPASLAFFILALGLIVDAGLQIWQYDRIQNAATARVSYILFLIFVLLSGGIVAGAYVAYHNYEKNYRTEIENELSAVAELKVNQLVQWRKERLGDGQVFYKNDLFSAIVKRYIQNKNDRDAKTGILTWVGQLQKAYNYDLMMLLDAQFNTLLVFPENKERTRLIIDRRNTEILMSGNIAFQDFYRNNQDQHIYLKILVPILENRSPKQLIGVLALRISPEEYLYPLIEKWPTPSRTSETLIIRRDGDSALFLNDLKFQKDAALSLRIPLERKDVPAVEAVLGQTGIIEGIDYRGVPVIADVCAVPDSPWFLVARMDLEEMYVPLKERLWLMIILVGALLIGAGTGVGFVWRQQRSRFYQEQYGSAEALRESEERFRTAFEYAPVGMSLARIDGYFLRVNNVLCKMLGYPQEELLKKNFYDITPPEDIELSKKMVAKSIDGQDFVSGFEKRYIGKDGKTIWVEISSSLLRDDKKQPLYFIVQTVDITERKQVEQSLQEATKERENLIRELQYALENIKTLQGLIPICSSCKKIRDDKGFWNQVEGYIMEHTDAKFSHGICPDCSKRLYGDLHDKAIEKQNKKIT